VAGVTLWSCPSRSAQVSCGRPQQLQDATAEWLAGAVRADQDQLAVAEDLALVGDPARDEGEAAAG